MGIFSNKIIEKQTADRQFADLPFGDLIEILQKEGFIIDAKDFVEFGGIYETLLERQVFKKDRTVSEQNDARQKLKFYLAPLVCRNHNEQEKFYQIFDNFFSEKADVVVEPEPDKVVQDNQTPPVRARWKKYVTPALVLLFFGVMFIYDKCKKDLTVPATTMKLPSPDSCWKGHSLPFSFTDSTGKTTQKDMIAEWSFGDGAATEKGFVVTHIFSKCGNYSVVLAIKDPQSEQYIARDTADIQIFSRSYLYTIGSQQKFFPGDSVTIIAEDVDNVYSNGGYDWIIENTALSKKDTVRTFIDTLRYALKDTGNFIAYLRAKEPECELKNMSIPFLVSARDPLQLVIKSQREPVKPAFKLNADIINPAITILMLILLGFLVYFFLKPIKPKLVLPVMEVDEGLGMEPPFEIPFLSKSNKIVRLQKQSYANFLLKQKAETDLPVLNIPKTIRNTINNVGFVKPEYSSRYKERDYLLLIDGNTTNGSQYVNLFTYLAKTFISDNINITYYFYYDNPSKVFKDKSIQPLNLAELRDKHYGATLLLLGNGYNMLHKSLPEVDSKLRNILALWQKRILITPVGSIDWAANEKILVSFFNIVPADIDGLIYLVKFINEDLPGNISFKIDAWKTYTSKFVNVDDIDTLEKYIDDDDVFQWLCACSVYPRLSWEVLIAIGKAVLGASKVQSKLNYSNLLKIARITWIEEGAFPDDIRLEMLKHYLSIPNQLVARHTMLNLMNESDNVVHAGSFSLEQKIFQKRTDAFLLYAHDSIKYKLYQEDALRFLSSWEKGAIPDAVLYSYLLNPSNKWKTPINSFSGHGKNVNMEQYIKEVTKTKTNPLVYLFGGLFFFLIPMLSVIFLSPGKIFTNSISMSFFDNKINKTLNILKREPVTLRVNIKLNECYWLFEKEAADKPTIYLIDNSKSDSSVIDSAKANIIYLDDKDEGLSKYTVQVDSDSVISFSSHNIDISEIQPGTLYLLIKNKTTKVSVAMAGNTNSLYKYNTVELLGSLCDTTPKTKRETFSGVLPSFLNEIWSTDKITTLLNIDLKRNVLYYSTGDKRTFGRYTINNVIKSVEGVYKIKTITNGATDVFFIRNVDSINMSFEFSVCQGIAKYGNRQIDTMTDANCSIYKQMTLYYENDSNKIFYPLTNNQLYKTERSKINMFNRFLKYKVLHYEGMHGRSESLAESYLRSRGINYTFDSRIGIPNPLPFQRDYDMLKIMPPDTTGSSPFNASVALYSGVEVTLDKTAYGILGYYLQNNKGEKFGICSSPIFPNANSNRQNVYLKSNNQSIQPLGIVYSQSNITPVIGLVKLENVKVQNRISNSVNINSLRNISFENISDSVYLMAQGQKLTGKIISINVSFKLTTNKGEIIIKDAIGTSIRGRAGLSGSILFDNRNNALGILVGSNDRYSFFVPLSKIIAEFNMKPITE